MNKTPKVLVLSAGDPARGQIAGAILRASAEGQFEVTTAALEAANPDPLVAEVMGEIDIDISSQPTKSVSESFHEHFGYVISVSDPSKHRFPVFPFAPHIMQWAAEDPGPQSPPEQRKDVLRRVRNQIRDKVQEFVEHVRHNPALHRDAA
jgi:protein-tyrosine-phosphatase